PKASRAHVDRLCQIARHSYRLQAAEALGEAPHRVLKTLMAEVDGKPVCVVVLSDAGRKLRERMWIVYAKSIETHIGCKLA
ncbi:hypothetical protein ACC785_38505, partial [Rhizobium ruizarguesonis]